MGDLHASTNPVNFAILTTKANDAVSHIHDCWHSVMIERLAREHRLAMQTPLLTISKAVVAVYGTPPRSQQCTQLVLGQFRLLQDAVQRSPFEVCPAVNWHDGPPSPVVRMDEYVVATFDPLQDKPHAHERTHARHRGR